MTSQTAAVVISNYSSWESKFAWQPTIASTETSSKRPDGGNGGGAVEPDNKKLQNTILSLQGQMKQVKAQKGAAVRHSDRAREAPKGKGKTGSKASGAQKSRGGKRNREW